MPPARRRPDPQTDYEDPVDRLYRRRDEPRGGSSKPKKKENPTATVSYYLGLVGLVPCLGAVLGPLAILLGIIGLVQAADPAVGGKGKAKSGIWFGVIALLVNYGVPLGLYGLVLAMR